MFCGKCGNKLPEGAKFCGSCGTKNEPVQSSYAVATESPPAHPIPVASVYAPPVQTAPSYQQTYTPPRPDYSEQGGNEPLRVGQYIGMLLLLYVPFLNIILLFVWGFGNSINLNKKNFARASLVLAAIGVVLSLIFGAALASIIRNLVRGMDSYY